MWNIKKHTKKENETYINARADEWTSLPIYATEIIVPPLMYFIKWYYIIIAVFVLQYCCGVSLIENLLVSVFLTFFGKLTR